MRRLVLIATILIIIAISMIAGYKIGVEKATTADGYVDGDMFVLIVDDNAYEWYID